MGRREGILKFSEECCCHHADGEGGGDGGCGAAAAAVEAEDAAAAVAAVAAAVAAVARRLRVVHRIWEKGRHTTNHNSCRKQENRDVF